MITPTPKQVLVAHLTSMHKGAPIRGTFDSLGRWHRLAHHRFSVNHFHEGDNWGAGDRPAGWRTGEGAVRKA